MTDQPFRVSANEVAEEKTSAPVFEVYRTNAVIIHAEGPFHTVEFPDEDRGQYDILSAATGGGIERVATFIGDDRCDLWVNDEFLITEPRPPFNPLATFLHMLGLKDEFKDQAYIAGDAILTGGCTYDGRTLPLTPTQTERSLDLLSSVQNAIEQHRRYMGG